MRTSRSIQNIRIERLWRDVRAGTLEAFRCIFLKMKEDLIYDSANWTHRVAIILVYRPRIQKSLDHTLTAWNNHKLRTERYKTPNALYALSRQQAIIGGYWNGDTGDSVDESNAATYGVDTEAPIPPSGEMRSDPTHRQGEGAANNKLEEDVMKASQALDGYDWSRDDKRYGIDVFSEAVILINASGVL